MKTKPANRPGWRAAVRAAVRGNVLMMGLVSLFNDASSEMIYPLLPVFIGGLASAGAAAVAIGAMEGICECLASFLKMYSGRVSDRLGRRKALAVAGYGFSAAIRPLMALAGAPWHVIALRMGDRVGKGLRTAPRDALIGDSVPAAARGMAFSFHRAMDHAGAVLGPLAAIAILYGFLGYGLWRDGAAAASPAEMHAMRWLFALALIPSLAAIAILILGVREIAPGKDPGPGDGTPPAGVSTPLPRRFYGFLAAVTLFALGNSSDLFLVFYGKTRFGLGLAQVIGLWVALHIAKIVFSLPGGALADRIGRRAAILGGWTIYALVYLGLALEPSAPLFWTLIAIYGAYYGLSEGAEKALVADCVPSAARGRAFGLYHGAIGLATLPASLLFGVFWAALGPARAFGIGAALAALAAAVLTISGKPHVEASN
jgi:MFS family permease